MSVGMGGRGGKEGSVNAERDSLRHSHLPGSQCWLRKLGRINNSSSSRDRTSYQLCFKYLPLGHKLIATFSVTTTVLYGASGVTGALNGYSPVLVYRRRSWPRVVE